MEDKMKYGSWKISNTRAIYGDVSVDIQKDNLVFAKGYFGEITKKHSVVISGICLFDATWSIKFTTGGVRSIALPLDRERVENRIRERGFEVDSVIFPCELSAYHKISIDFLAKSIIELRPKHLLYHIPIEEYKVYLANLEELIGVEILKATNVIDSFADKIKQYFINKMKEIDFEDFEFISPMKIGVDAVEDSYSLPYAKPEKFGVKREDLYAIEDLVELTISIQTQKNHGHLVPVLFFVLDCPHPYMKFTKKDLLKRKDVIIIEV